MKISWLEDMVKEGSVSAAARNEIYRDCLDVLKLAKTASDDVGAVHGAAEPPSRFAPIMALLAQYAPSMAMSAAAAGFKGLLSARELSNTASAIAANQQYLKALPELSKHQEKVIARFRDLVAVAPTVASNRALAEKFITSKLHSGFTDGDIQNLAMLQATYSSDMKRQQRLSSSAETRLNKNASATRLGEMYADVYCLTKEAGVNWPRVGNLVKTMTLLSSIPVLSGLGTAAVKQLVATRDKEELEKRLKASFDKAMSLSNPLESALHSNKAKARQAFETLVHFAPHVAAEPNAARAFMEKLVSYDTGIQASDVKDLSEIERNIKGVERPSPFFSGFGAGVQATGLQQAFGHVAKGQLEGLLDTAIGG